MRCPSCGKELIEGKLLCENCGYEIEVVPEYEIEVENEMKNALSQMTLDFPEEDEEFYDEEYVSKHSFINTVKHLIERINKGFFVIILCGAALFAIIVSSILLFLSKTENSFEYQYEKAIECASQNHYDEAVVFLEHALALDPNNTEARFLLAKYYDRSDRTKSAIKILTEILQMDANLIADNEEEIFDFLISLHEKRQEYELIGEILKKCDYPQIISKYGKYAAMTPEFSMTEGVYDEIISISLKSENQGIIYYTLDGTTPSTNSSVYESPILLESGDYVVKAMFVNMYGIASDVISKSYYISLVSPNEPVINLESGNYMGPQFIEVFHDDSTKIFYTIDGTEPSEHSIRYTEALEMPYGFSNFAFIAINNKGLKSSVVRRTFRLTADAVVSDELAVQVLMNHLIVCGEITDNQGHLSNKLGVNIYTVSSIVNMNSKNYFILKEKYVDTTGREHNTNNMFAVDTDSGEAYKARKISEGKYLLTKFD